MSVGTSAALSDAEASDYHKAPVEVQIQEDWFNVRSACECNDSDTEEDKSIETEN